MKSQIFRMPVAPFPRSISPMLATLIDKPFEESGWLYEIKWDGYRAIALCNKKNISLLSRNNKSFDQRFYSIHNELAKLNLHVVLDGEIVVVDDKGVSHFGALQNWRSDADGELVYYVFDLLWVDGHSTLSLPLAERKKLLDKTLPQNKILRKSEIFEASAKDLLERAKKNGLEGIIAKKADSVYTPGLRSRDWLKIKTHKRQEVVIGGFTKREGSPKTFSSLLVGVFAKGHFKYMGKIGTGFSDSLQKKIMQKFKRHIVKQSPFDNMPVERSSRITTTWLEPELVCEVSYTELTTDGLMRHPSFEGMREDKPARSVVEEKEMTVDQVIKKKPGRK